jgi:hypothetical protein
MIFLGVSALTWAEESWMAEVAAGRGTEWPRARYLRLILPVDLAWACVRSAALSGDQSVGVDSSAYECALPRSAASATDITHAG